jgi:hypothetical protein
MAMAIREFSLPIVTAILVVSLLSGRDVLREQLQLFFRACAFAIGIGCSFSFDFILLEIARLLERLSVAT